MKVLLDEDVPVQLLATLRRVLDSHTVDHVQELGWTSKKDTALLADAAQRGYEAFVTNDKNQLHDVQESRAIRDSGMHHVRYQQDTGRGKEGLGLAMASVLAAAVPLVAELAAAPGQRLARITSITAHPASRRYTVLDPVVDPPAYWPRSGAAPRRPRTR